MSAAPAAPRLRCPACGGVAARQLSARRLRIRCASCGAALAVKLEAVGGNRSAGAPAPELPRAAPADPAVRRWWE